MKNFFLGCLLIVAFVSCSSDDDGDGGVNVKDQLVTGTVQSRPFTFVGGKAFLTTNFNQEEAVSVNLTNVTANCDSSIFDYDLSISVIVPNKIGVFTEVNVVTNDDDSVPSNHLNETVEITAISATEITGKIKLNDPASGVFKENIFEGTFTLPICSN